MFDKKTLELIEDAKLETERFHEMRRTLLGVAVSVRSTMSKSFDASMVEKCDKDVARWCMETMGVIKGKATRAESYTTMINHVMGKLSEEVAQHVIASRASSEQPATTHSAQPTNN